MLNKLSLRRFCAPKLPQDGSFHVPKDGVCGSPPEASSRGVELLLKDLIRTSSRGVELLLKDLIRTSSRGVELLLKDLIRTSSRGVELLLKDLVRTL